MNAEVCFLGDETEVLNRIFIGFLGNQTDGWGLMSFCLIRKTYSIQDLERAKLGQSDERTIYEVMIMF